MNLKSFAKETSIWGLLRIIFGVLIILMEVFYFSKRGFLGIGSILWVVAGIALIASGLRKPKQNILTTETSVGTPNDLNKNPVLQTVETDTGFKFKALIFSCICILPTVLTLNNYRKFGAGEEGFIVLLGIPFIMGLIVPLTIKSIASKDYRASSPFNMALIILGTFLFLVSGAIYLLVVLH